MKQLKKISLLSLLILCFFVGAAFSQTQDYKNTKLPLIKRSQNLVSLLTLPEKISLLGYKSKSVTRLGIPAYNWWNEGLHGVARAGEATIFPQAIGMAASFNKPLLKQVATIISTEARAKNNLAVAKNIRTQYLGLTYWSPNINIFRDPRWGRGQETYGEDPFLTGEMGLAFVNGLQGNNSKYLKVAACAKHYAVHSGPESERHSFDAIVNETDLRETYLPAFEKLVRGGVESVMGAYNRVNGEPANTGKTLLSILRNEWQFKGHLVTDCWALEDIYKHHKVLPNSVAVAGAAIKAGVNLDCSDLLQRDLLAAVKQDLVTEKEIDSALVTLLKTQFKLGFYDGANNNPYKKYNKDSIRNSYHLAVTKQMATESMVLLKNNNNILPLNKNKIQKLQIVGTHAFSAEVLLANYHGFSPDLVTFAEGITRAVQPHVKIDYNMSVTLQDSTRFGALWDLDEADAVIAVLGSSPLLEGEEGDAFLSKSGADRNDISLPTSHIVFLKKLRETVKKPIILVLTGGSALDVKAVEPYADAIVLAWYPGEQGGNAFADLLFGKQSPSGKLPLTFYNSLTDLPAYNDYNMQNRTYRYFKGEVQYPFGFGLSYTTFKYNWLQQLQQKYSDKDTLNFSINVANTGVVKGAEVVQVYVQYPNMPNMPVKELKFFKKISINTKSKQTVNIAIPVAELKKWDIAKNKYTVNKGIYTLQIGSHSLDKKLTATIEIK